MKTYFGIIKIKQDINTVSALCETNGKKGVVISTFKEKINPAFFLESDELAERCLVKRTTQDCFWVDSTIYNKKDKKTHTKNLYFDNEIELQYYLVDFFNGVKNFFTSGAPDNKDINMYFNFLMNKEDIDTQIVEL